MKHSRLPLGPKVRDSDSSVYRLSSATDRASTVTTIPWIMPLSKYSLATIANQLDVADCHWQRCMSVDYSSQGKDSRDNFTSDLTMVPVRHNTRRGGARLHLQSCAQIWGLHTVLAQLRTWNIARRHRQRGIRISSAGKHYILRWLSSLLRSPGKSTAIHTLWQWCHQHQSWESFTYRPIYWVSTEHANGKRRLKISPLCV